MGADIQRALEHTPLTLPASSGSSLLAGRELLRGLHKLLPDVQEDPPLMYSLLSKIATVAESILPTTAADPLLLESLLIISRTGKTDRTIPVERAIAHLQSAREYFLKFDLASYPGDLVTTIKLLQYGQEIVGLRSHYKCTTEPDIHIVYQMGRIAGIELAGNYEDVVVSLRSAESLPAALKAALWGSMATLQLDSGRMGLDFNLTRSNYCSIFEYHALLRADNQMRSAKIPATTEESEALLQVNRRLIRECLHRIATVYVLRGEPVEAIKQHGKLLRSPDAIADTDVIENSKSALLSAFRGLGGKIKAELIAQVYDMAGDARSRSGDQAKLCREQQQKFMDLWYSGHPVRAASELDRAITSFRAGLDARSHLPNDDYLALLWIRVFYDPELPKENRLSGEDLNINLGELYHLAKTSHSPRAFVYRIEAISEMSARFIADKQERVALGFLDEGYTLLWGDSPDHPPLPVGTLIRCYRIIAEKLAEAGGSARAEALYRKADELISDNLEQAGIEDQYHVALGIAKFGLMRGLVNNEDSQPILISALKSVLLAESLFSQFADPSDVDRLVGLLVVKQKLLESNKKKEEAKEVEQQIAALRRRE